MKTSQGQPGIGQRALSTGVIYLLLFVLGGLQGVIGSFQYSRGPVPLVAIVADVIILVTCLLAGWGMRTYGASVLPALGWLAASFILAMPRSNGSVVITATTAGEWYLYGGAIAAMTGAVTAFLVWARPRYRSRP